LTRGTQPVRLRVPHHRYTSCASVGAPASWDMASSGRSCDNPSQDRLPYYCRTSVQISQAVSSVVSNIRCARRCRPSNSCIVTDASNVRKRCCSQYWRHLPPVRVEPARLRILVHPARVNCAIDDLSIRACPASLASDSGRQPLTESDNPPYSPVLSSYLLSRPVESP